MSSLLKDLIKRNPQVITREEIKEVEKEITKLQLIQQEYGSIINIEDFECGIEEDLNQFKIWTESNEYFFDIVECVLPWKIQVTVDIIKDFAENMDYKAVEGTYKNVSNNRPFYLIELEGTHDSNGNPYSWGWYLDNFEEISN